MADEQYTFCLLYVPFEVAKIRLPRGLPAGQPLESSDFTNHVLCWLHHQVCKGLHD